MGYGKGGDQYKEIIQLIGEVFPGSSVVAVYNNKIGRKLNMEQERGKLENIGALWLKKSKSGKFFLNGNLKGDKIVAFFNEDYHPSPVLDSLFDEQTTKPFINLRKESK